MIAGPLEHVQEQPRCTDTDETKGSPIRVGGQFLVLSTRPDERTGTAAGPSRLSESWNSPLWLGRFIVVRQTSEGILERLLQLGEGCLGMGLKFLPLVRTGSLKLFELLRC